MFFPHMVAPFFVSRDSSIRALDHALDGNKKIFLAAQKSPTVDHPGLHDLFAMGTIATIVRLLHLPDGTVKVVAQGQQRAWLNALDDDENKGERCRITPIEIEEKSDLTSVEALSRSVLASFETYVNLRKRYLIDNLNSIRMISDPNALADTIASHIDSAKIKTRQSILETLDILERLEKLFELIEVEIDISYTAQRMRSRTKKQVERSRKERQVNHKTQAPGQASAADDENDDLEAQIEKKNIPKEAKKKILKEMHRLRLMQPMSTEATIIRSYIDWVLGLPWGEYTQRSFDIDQAEAILEEAHYGLARVKERILEHLAVQKLVEHGTNNPVLCLVGPPGVGKTSLARSIAKATGRNFVRLSLGGVRDEAEIRGHRRTYVGAMPGRIIQSMHNAQSDNPVFLLDEVDKMSSDLRGDPAAALLEVLDPEQCHNFSDHYLDLDYDLSRVMFIATANSLTGIPLPLRDRMEMIHVSGYTDAEKVNIAMRYLLPRQHRATGIKTEQININDNSIKAIVQHYTQESGVRELDRQISKIFRNVARKIQRPNSPATYNIFVKSLPRYLGVPKYQISRANKRDEVGVVTGLAYTNFGGATLECEVAVIPGSGKLVITGLVEKGMQESAQAAMSYVRARHQSLSLDATFYQKLDFHIHFPEFVSKDGPSAGITMATSIISALLNVPVRRDVAMTGEITLRGRILPIGGLKEKLLAAQRAGISSVLIPRDNRKDLRELPKSTLQSLRIVFVECMDEVLREALRLEKPLPFFSSLEPCLEYRHGKPFKPEGRVAQR